MPSISWFISGVLVGCSGSIVADAFLPLSSFGSNGFFHQAKRVEGAPQFIRKDAKHLDRFHSIIETATRMAEEAALMTEPLTSATTRFLMDRVGDAHHQLLDKTIGEMKAQNTMTLNDDDDDDDVPGLPATTSSVALSEDVWGDNASSIQAASEQFQKDLQTAKKVPNTEKQKEEQLLTLANASLGLTAPLNLLKDTELKNREQEITMPDERAQKQAQIAKEQAELRDLMKHIQCASMEKKQRAKDAREKGSFPVILAALAESDSDALKKPEPEMFQRVSRTKTSAPAIGSKDEMSFEQLNKQIRMKYEQEKIKQKTPEKREKIVVVKKLERNDQRGVGLAVLRLIKRSLTPLRDAISKQP